MNLHTSCVRFEMTTCAVWGRCRAPSAGVRDADVIDRRRRLFRHHQSSSDLIKERMAILLMNWNDVFMMDMFSWNS